MSYILEALKKAQAERQLGSAPTVHTMTIEPVSSAGEGRARVPLWGVIGVGVLGACAVAAYAWRSAPASAPAAVVLTAPTPAAATAPVVAQAPAAVPAPAVMAPVIVTPPPAPIPAPAAAPAMAKAPVAEKAVAATTPAPSIVAARPTPARPESPAIAAPAEDSYPTQQSLPDAVQRELPQVVFGGYMYSKNPADRLLLIDKVLRHEGEEVAPGLTLERLLPKAAVMNYRGFRYRVPY